MFTLFDYYFYEQVTSEMEDNLYKEVIKMIKDFSLKVKRQNEKDGADSEESSVDNI